MCEPSKLWQVRYASSFCMLTAPRQSCFPCAARQNSGVALSGELSFYASMETGHLGCIEKLALPPWLLENVPGSFADAHWNMTHK